MAKLIARVVAQAGGSLCVGFATNSWLWMIAATSLFYFLAAILYELEKR